LTIPITANVLPRFELLPEAINLPRSSASGPLYGGYVICRSVHGSKLTLNPVTIPDDLTVRIEEAETGGPMKKVIVAVPPGKVRTGPRITRQVVLSAHDGEAAELLTLDITVSPPDKP
jgi:hypothetical protein